MHIPPSQPRSSSVVRALAGAGICAFLALAVHLPAWADRLIVQRGQILYVAAPEGTEAPRRLFSFGTSTGDEMLWEVSPTGRRIVWMTRPSAPASGADASAAAAAPSGLASRPLTLYVSEITGRHEKRLLTTADLRDRQGQKVATLETPPAEAGAEPTAGPFDDWEPVSLSWSADGRTVYLSCISSAAPGGGKATYAADAASGIALVDADDRWRSLAPATDLDARGALLVGAGLARFTASQEPGTPQRYAPVVVFDLAAGTHTPLFTASGDGSALPDYAVATDCALSPDRKTIVFVGSGKGLWIVDRKTRTYRRLVAGSVLQPRWSPDGKQIYFLLQRPLDAATPPAAEAEASAAGGVAAASYDLYAVTPPAAVSDMPADETVTPPLRLVLQNVERFDVVPD